MGPGTGLSCDITLNTKLNAEERRRFQDPATIRRVLATAKTVGVVGLSSDRQKASWFVANYLQCEGYRIVPINPKAEEILGERCYPDVASVPDDVKIDVLDIFRPPREIPAIVEQALAKDIPVIWFQLRLVDMPSAEKTVAAGRTAIVDKCVKMEHGRYTGQLNWAGMNTELISARKAQCPRR